MDNKDFHLDHKTTILVNLNIMHATCIYKTSGDYVRFKFIISRSLSSEADNKISLFLLVFVSN